MSDSTNWLDTLSASDSQKEITNNELFDAASPATLFGRHASACSALTWAYYGGRFFDGANVVHINNGTLSLTNNATNYIEATTAGVVSANTSGFTAGRIRIAKVVTLSGAVSTYEDHRAFVIGPNGPGSSATTIAYADLPNGVIGKPRVDAHTYSASVTLNAASYDAFEITLTGNITIAFTGGTDGQRILVRLTQDGTGTRLVTWDASVAFGSDITGAGSTASVAASKIDYFGLIYSSASSKYHMVSFARGY